MNIDNSIFIFSLLSCVVYDTSGSIGNFELSSLVDIDDFYKLVVNDVFVDKSSMIETFVKRKQSITRIVRPRKWGKTVNMDMIRRFLEIEIDPTSGRRVDKERSINRKLFLGGNITTSDGRTKRLTALKVAGVPEILDRLGEYPVISINFKSIVADNYDESIQKLNRLLADQFRRHRHVVDSLNEPEKRVWNDYLLADENINKNETIIKNSLKFLSEALFRHYRRGVYVLADDYHRPFFYDFHRRLLEERTVNPASTDQEVYAKTAELTELHRLLSIIEGTLYRCLEDGDNDVVNGALLTDVYDLDLTGAYYERLRTGRTYTFTDSTYINAYGFTLTDLLRVVSNNRREQSSLIDSLRRWYGYNFTDYELFNPYSVRRWLANKGEFRVYWINDETDEETIIEDVLSADSMQEDLQHFIDGRKIVCQTLHSKIALHGLPTDTKALLQAGYLSVSSNVRETLEVCKPNLEIDRLFKGHLRRWMRFKFKLTERDQTTMADNLAEFDVNSLEKRLRSIMAAVPDDIFEAEICYNGLVKSLIYSLEDRYDVVEIDELEWKPNVVLIAKPDNDCNKAIILYYKVIDTTGAIEDKGKSALLRLEEKLKNLHLAKKYVRIKRILKLVLIFCQDLIDVQYRIEDVK